MFEYADELALLWCVLLNVAVFGSAYRFAVRRMTRDRTQAILDAALAGFAIQYASICLPGILGALRPSAIDATAVLLSTLLWAGAGRAPKAEPQLEAQRNDPGWLSWVALVSALFAAGYVLGLVRLVLVLPPMSNDALTYHFPAAVQWLQTGRLGLFPTWFFNPANTYSPLAGSTFIAWLLAPFDNDVLARFVEVPALAVVGVATFQVCRQLGSRTHTAAIVASAAVLSRPLVFASIMGKDDLFVATFFLMALIAMTPARARESFATIRLGVAVGLLVATKYTALLSVPILLLAIDGPWRAGWRWRSYLTVAGVAILVGGPWYWRNIWLTGNPLFPIDVSIGNHHLLRGLFTADRSDRLRSVGMSWEVLTGGDYGLVPPLMCAVAIGWLLLLVNCLRPRSRLRPIPQAPPTRLSDPLLRACLLGAPLGIALFAWRSPFPEVRFCFPPFLLLFACLAAAVDLWIRPPIISGVVATGVFVLAWWTAPANPDRSVEFAISGAIVAVVGFAALWSTRNWRPKWRWSVVVGGVVIGMIVYAFVYWAASLNGYRQTLFAGWEMNYPRQRPLFQFVAEHVPRDATVAYTNLYIVYPLQGFSLDRKIVYAPTRPGVRSPADLPWLGNHLPGEQLVPAAVRETLANPDRQTWLENLSERAAQYLVIDKTGATANPPEADFAASDPKHFRKLFEDDAGIVYAIDGPIRE